MTCEGVDGMRGRRQRVRVSVEASGGDESSPVGV